MSKSALLILDMLNTFEFPEAPALKPFALKAAKQTHKLKQRLKAKKIPIIYVNDNFANWKSNWEEIYELCTQDGSPGKDIAELLKPDKDDYFILKPKHSGFYSTSLESLLDSLNVKKLILTGIAGNICVLFTANDAHMRDYQIVVPRDCIASNTKKDNDYALRQFRDVFKFSVPYARNLKV